MQLGPKFDDYSPHVPKKSEIEKLPLEYRCTPSCTRSQIHKHPLEYAPKYTSTHCHSPNDTSSEVVLTAKYQKDADMTVMCLLMVRNTPGKCWQDSQKSGQAYARAIWTKFFGKGQLYTTSTEQLLGTLSSTLPPVSRPIKIFFHELLDDFCLLEG